MVTNQVVVKDVRTGSTLAEGDVTKLKFLGKMLFIYLDTGYEIFITKEALEQILGTKVLEALQ